VETTHAAYDVGRVGEGTGTMKKFVMSKETALAFVTEGINEIVAGTRGVDVQGERLTIGEIVKRGCMVVITPGLFGVFDRPHLENAVVKSPKSKFRRK